LAVEERDPPQAHVASLLDHYQRGRFSDVEKLGISLTKKFPHHQLTWKVLGATLNQLGKFQQSLAPNQKAVRLAPNDAEAYVILGSTLQELRRFEDAEANYKKAIALKPDFAAAHYCLGTARQALGRLEEC
jgi:protein O-GlcNAc transferase